MLASLRSTSSATEIKYSLRPEILVLEMFAFRLILVIDTFILSIYRTKYFGTEATVRARAA